MTPPRDPIPCWLTNRDLLTPVRGMVECLRRAEGVGPITIVDCDSTYPPLLDWYAGCSVTVIRADNLGPRAPWRYVPDAGEGFFFVSDADLDLFGTPPDFLHVLADGLRGHPDRIKVGLSLAIDDLPDASPIAEAVRKHERQFWTDPLSGGRYYAANLDTTAAVYRQGETGRGHYGPALRTAPPYTCRHLPWYLTRETLTAEWRHFLGRAGYARATFSGPRLKELL